jgi:hypothetical protein
MIAFCNRLRSSERDRQRYAKLKRQLAEQDWPDMNAYAQAKTDLITEILVLKRTNSGVSTESMIRFPSGGRIPSRSVYWFRLRERPA